MNRVLEFDLSPLYIEGGVNTYEEIESFAYEYLRNRGREKALAEEGLIYLFKEWLDLVSPADFGDDEGEGVLV
jgi:hypothetical protein